MATPDDPRRQALIDQIPTGGTAPAATPPDALRNGSGAVPEWASDSEVGRNVYNTAMALPGISRALPAAAATGGAISNALRWAGHAGRLISDSVAGYGAQRAYSGLGQPTPPTNLRDPAITGPSVVRPSDTFAGPDVRYAGADYQPPAAQPPANPNTPTNDVTKTVGPDGRVSYSGGNVGGNITINGSGQLGGGSISPQNMAAADALAGRQAQQSAQRAMADMPMAQAPTVLHSGNDWASRNALRNLEVTASSAMNYSERCSSRETYRI